MSKESKEYMASAHAYYTAMGNRDIAGLERLLDPDVQFLGPMAEMVGKQRVLEAAKKIFLLPFNQLNIRAKFGEGDQVALVYDLHFPPPIGISRATSLISFKNGLISRIELFYDGRPFAK